MTPRYKLRTLLILLAVLLPLLAGAWALGQDAIARLAGAHHFTDICNRR